MKAIKPKVKSNLFKVISKKANHDPTSIDDIIDDLAIATNIYRCKLTRIMNNKHVNWDVSELVKIAHFFRVPYEDLVDSQSILKK